MWCWRDLDAPFFSTLNENNTVTWPARLAAVLDLPPLWICRCSALAAFHLPLLWIRRPQLVTCCLLLYRHPRFFSPSSFSCCCLVKVSTTVLTHNPYPSHSRGFTLLVCVDVGACCSLQGQGSCVLGLSLTLYSAEIP